MLIPARILRATAESHHKRPEPTARELARENRILDVAQSVMAEHGREACTLTTMALAVRMAPATVRHYFCDLDALLAELLHRHLFSLAKAFGEIPYGDPETHRKRRALYLALTRTPLGGLNAAHLLLIRDRRLLPPDLRPSVEAHRYSIGLMLAGPDGERAFDILDSPRWDAATIELVLSTITPQTAEAAQPPAAEPAPAPTPPAAPPLLPAAKPASAPTPPPPPALPPVTGQQLRARWPHLALEPAPGDPPDDLTRLGRGFAAPKLTDQTFAHPPPDPDP